MNTRGGGIVHVNDFQSDEMQIFRGGLRHLPAQQGALLYDSKNSIRNFHDKLSYERGFIQHSRSNSNQFLNFHFMFGGFNKYVVQRLFYQTWYKKHLRVQFFPALIGYTSGCMWMRMYDNAAYDYFYFIE